MEKGKDTRKDKGKDSRKDYVKPVTKKHKPIDIVRGSGSASSLYSGGLYVECSLYYYY